jgi:hypothetical protein
LDCPGRIVDNIRVVYQFNYDRRPDPVTKKFGQLIPNSVATVIFKQIKNIKMRLSVAEDWGAFTEPAGLASSLPLGLADWQGEKIGRIRLALYHRKESITQVEGILNRHFLHANRWLATGQGEEICRRPYRPYRQPCG